MMFIATIRLKTNRGAYEDDIEVPIADKEGVRTWLGENLNLILPDGESIDGPPEIGNIRKK